MALIESSVEMESFTTDYQSMPSLIYGCTVYTYCGQRIEVEGNIFAVAIVKSVGYVPYWISAMCNLPYSGYSV